MRNLLITVLLFIITFSLSAQNVDLQDALKVAKSKLLKDNKTGYSVNVDYLLHKSSSGTPLFFEFGLSPIGYIVVSGNYSLPPIIAYSYNNNIDTEGKLASIISKDISQKLSYIQNAGNNIVETNQNLWNHYLNNILSKKLSEQWPAAGTTISGGWVETNWTQSAPYNNFCPVDPTNDNRSIAGCPSVAMGMIVDFHKTTNNVSFDDGDDYHHNYAGRNYWIDDDYLIRDFPSWPMLNTYLDTIEEHYISGASLTNNDKAALVFACGVAAKQVYTSSGSGTFSVSQAYDAYLKFNFNQAQLLDTSDIADSSFYKIIIQNIKDTLPVHLAIVDSLWNTGHNIVVDGYNTDGFFHFNFGWGGSSNGWYQMLDGMPYSMNFIEGAVVNIKPGSSSGIRKKFCSDILFYPNPVSDIITIELPENTSNNNLLFVFNSLGQEIIQTHLSTDNVNKIHLNLSQLCVGVYSIIIKTENNIFRFRIIKS